MFKPSKYQEAIFLKYKTTNENLVVQAAPGSGKTTTLQLLTELTPINKKCFATSFNKSLVEELKIKITKSNFSVSTLHSFGLSSIYKYHKAKIKVYDLKSFIIIQRLNNDLWHIKNKKELNPLIYNIIKIWDYYRINMVDSSLDPKYLTKIVEDLDLDFDEEDFRYFEDFKLLVNKHNKGLDKREILIDFTDMLYFPVHFNYTYENHKYDELFIDECQDLNKLAQELLKRILEPTGRFIAVGDKRQSIYGFMGADAKAFENLENQPNTTSLPLSVSYRCAKQIIKKASEVWEGVEAFEDNEEGLVKDGLSKDPIDGDFVLCRNNQPLIEYYITLLKSSKSAYIKGKDLGENLMKFIEFVSSEEEYLEVKARQITKLMAKLKERGSPNPTQTKQFRALKEKTDILEILIKEFKDFDKVKNVLNQMFKEKGDGIQLMTCHKSKGLETDRVFILRPDLMPSEYAITLEEKNQESNLKFVAFTRAKKELIFITDIKPPKKKEGNFEIIKEVIKENLNN